MNNFPRKKINKVSSLVIIFFFLPRNAQLPVIELWSDLRGLRIELSKESNYKGEKALRFAPIKRLYCGVYMPQ